MKSIGNIIERIISALAAIAIILMMVHVVAHALMRFLLNSPIYGTNELVEYWYLPAIALLGIPVAQLQREHITVTLIFERMNSLSRRICASVAFAFGSLISIGFAWYGFDEAESNTAISSTAGVTDIATWPIYYLVPIVFGVLALLYIAEIVHTWRPKSTDEPLAANSEDRSAEETAF